MRLLAIDPGWASGAAAVLEDGVPVAAWRLPYDNKAKQPKFKLIINQLRRTNVDMAAVEVVHAFPKQGVSSVWSFAQGYGFVLGVIMTLEIEIIPIYPHDWKPALVGAGKDKSASIEYVQDRFPDFNLAPGRLRVPNNNLADAVCIGVYAYHTHIK